MQAKPTSPISWLRDSAEKGGVSLMNAEDTQEAVISVEGLVGRGGQLPTQRSQTMAFTKLKTIRTMPCDSLSIYILAP